MKKIHFKLLIIGVLTLTSCLEQELITPQIISESSNTNASAQNTQMDAPTIVRDQLVVRFGHEGLSDTHKDNIRRAFATEYLFKIDTVETCGCGISDLELWTIDTTVIDAHAYLGIEGVVRGLKNDSGEGDMSGDYQFTITLNSESTDCEGKMNIEERVVAKNPSSIKIAIIDTGIDYNFFRTPFLYNSANAGTSSTEISGWDFINQDNDPMDDKGHGTFVSKIITDPLDSLQIPYQILPIKAFDDAGRGTYFQTTCALKYALSKPDIDIVNMSFGWGQLDSLVIMKSFFDENSSNILFVTSAGNHGIDTDSQGNSHFPSGYNSDNLLTVAGYEISQDPNVPLDDFISGAFNRAIRASESNYGSSSIDIAAPYTFAQTLKSRDCSIEIELQGTSYSSPFAVVRAAQILYANPQYQPIVLKSKIISSGYTSSSMQGLTSSGRVLDVSSNSSRPSSFNLRFDKSQDVITRQTYCVSCN